MTTKTMSAQYDGETYSVRIKQSSRKQAGGQSMTAWIDEATDSNGVVVTDERILDALRVILGVS